MAEIRVLFIPADPALPLQTRVIDPRDLAAVLGAKDAEHTRFDAGVEMWIDDTGRIDGKPMNYVATRYIKTRSDAARQGGAGQEDPSYGLYGDVVVTGLGMTEVPERLIDQFQQAQVESIRSPEELRLRVQETERQMNELGEKLEVAQDAVREGLISAEDPVRKAAQDAYVRALDVHYAALLVTERQATAEREAAVEHVDQDHGR